MMYSCKHIAITESDAWTDNMTMLPVALKFERFHVQESRLEDLSAHSSPEGEAMRTILRKHSEIAQKI